MTAAPSPADRDRAEHLVARAWRRSAGDTAIAAVEALIAAGLLSAPTTGPALPEHLRGDVPCSRCGTFDLPVWSTDNVFWNAVVRSAPLPWCEGDGLMCITCFVRLADERGFDPHAWRLLPDWPWRENRREASLPGSGEPG